MAANTGLGMPVLGPLLASRDRLVAVALAERTDLTADAVSMLLAHPDGLVRKTLAGNPVAALTAWSRLVEDEDVGVRTALAKGHSTDFRPKVNRPLPEQAQTRLAADPEVEVRRALAHRRDLTASSALRDGQDFEVAVRLDEIVVRYVRMAAQAVSRALATANTPYVWPARGVSAAANAAPVTAGRGRCCVGARLSDADVQHGVLTGADVEREEVNTIGVVR